MCIVIWRTQLLLKPKASLLLSVHSLPMAANVLMTKTILQSGVPFPQFGMLVMSSNAIGGSLDLVQCV